MRCLSPPVQRHVGHDLASRKLSFVDLLGAICLFVNASKGLSAVQLSRDLDVQYKTAFVLMHKLREVMAAETRDMRLSGHVEVDGAASAGMSDARHAAKTASIAACWRNRSGKRRVVRRMVGGISTTKLAAGFLAPMPRTPPG